MHFTRSSSTIFRWSAYLLGLLILALGISMNTKAGLGVSPIISVSFSVSSIWSHNFGNITLVLYTCFILVEVVLHSMLLRRGKLPGGMGRTILLLDALQFPLSLVFTRFLNWFSVWLPDCLRIAWAPFGEPCLGKWSSWPLPLCSLASARPYPSTCV